MAACPKLTELTVIYSFPGDARPTETGILLDPAGRVRSTISELVIACKALQDFDTFQIARFPIKLPCLVCWRGRVKCHNHPHKELWEGVLEKEMKDLRDWAIDPLKEPRTGVREGEGRKTTLRVIEFTSGRHSVKVEEREV